MFKFAFTKLGLLQNRVLVVEASTHYMMLEQTYHLLKEKCDLVFFVIREHRYRYLELFPSAKETRVITNNFRGILLFFSLLLRGWRYKWIVISTGPEDSHYTAFLNIIGFYLCCKLYGNKIILTIRNIKPFLTTTPGLMAQIRNRGIRFVPRFMFETETMKREFYMHLGRRDGLYTVSYVRYSNTISGVLGGQKNITREKLVFVGLLGSIDSERRDYNVVFEALKKLSPETLIRMKFIILGRCQGGLENRVIQYIRSFVRVEYINDNLSERDFALNGSACDVLLAPLSKQMPYGLLKGTGAFGDAIYLQRKLLIPDFSDPQREFDRFCLYYQNSIELASLLNRVCKDAQQVAPDRIFQRYSTQSVLDSIVSDLRLDFS